MNLKNDGLTVGELSITIAAIIIIGFIWTNLNKNKGNQEVSCFIDNSSEISSSSIQNKQIYKDIY
tara:strand:+ start:322 stop:516 length:195 start_codon:yes stop_codon:yes gene_type:complete